MAFIVDSSGSIGRRKWPLVLDFLKKVISEFNVGPDGTHVAVVAYSTNPKLEFPFNVVSGDQITAEEYGKRIDRIRFQRGYTYIDKALKLANEQVFVTSAGMRSDVPKVYTPTFASVFLLMNSDSSQEARDALGELSNKLCISNSYKLHSCHRLCFLQVLSSDKKIILWVVMFSSTSLLIIVRSCSTICHVCYQFYVQLTVGVICIISTDCYCTYRWCTNHDWRIYTTERGLSGH